jgi:hypothetical protein
MNFYFKRKFLLLLMITFIFRGDNQTDRTDLGSGAEWDIEFGGQKKKNYERGQIFKNFFSIIIFFLIFFLKICIITRVFWKILRPGGGGPLPLAGSAPIWIKVESDQTNSIRLSGYISRIGSDVKLSSVRSFEVLVKKRLKQSRQVVTCPRCYTHLSCCDPHPRKVLVRT